MNLQIDGKIREALRLAILRAGNAAKFAQALGTQASTVGRWRTGAVRAIEPPTWTRLYPLLRDFLPGEYQPGTVEETAAPWPAAKPPEPAPLDPEATEMLELFHALPEVDRQELLRSAQRAALRRFRESRGHVG